MENKAERINPSWEDLRESKMESMTIFVERCPGFELRDYWTVSGLVDGEDAPFDSEEFDSESDAIAHASETRDSCLEYYDVTLLVDGNERKPARRKPEPTIYEQHSCDRDLENALDAEEWK